MIIKNVLVFNKKSFDFRILNSNKSIVQIIDKAPVVSKIEEKEICVGFISNPYIKNNMIFGDVFIFPKYIEFKDSEVISQEIIIKDSNKKGKTYFGDDVVIKEIIIHVKPRV